MIEIKLTPSVANDITAREIPDPPFNRITKPGTYQLTTEEAYALLDETDYYTAPGGPAETLPPAQRRAYKQLHNTLTQLLAATPRPPRPTPTHNKPFTEQWETTTLGTLRPGTIFKLNNELLVVDDNQTDAPTNQLWVRKQSERSGTATRTLPTNTIIETYKPINS